MKATLKFNTEDPDDKLAFMRATKADILCHVLFDLVEWLRSEVKYHNKDYNEVRKYLAELMEDNDINLDIIYP